jgi:TrmH family RNA methyltransferase
MSAVGPPRRIDAVTDEVQLLSALLTNRTKRHRRRRLVVQGVRGIDAAVEHGWTIRQLLTPAGRRLSSWAGGIMTAQPAAEHVELSPDAFAQLADKQDPGELLAVVELRDTSLDSIALDATSLLVVLEQPASPGNVGSIVRSADALGASAVVVTGHGADPYDPRAVRASVGSVFALPVALAPSIASVIDRWPGLRVVGADERGIPLARTDIARPLAIACGSEGRGLSRGARDCCAELAAIPMSGSASSLNVAAAAAIFLYETARRAR